MPVLCYQITGATTPNARSTTGALDGQLSAILKCDHAEANAQVYSELAANRLAAFLGIPVVIGVPAVDAQGESPVRFAALRAAEAGLNFYDFTSDDHGDPDECAVYDTPPLPAGVLLSAGHLRAVQSLCEKYPLQTAAIAVFDLWIGNNDRAFNFKAQLAARERGVIFALDQGSSLLACHAEVGDSLRELENAGFPSFHPFQKLVNARYCGAMVERISSMPDWAVQAATTYDDTVGNVTLDEQYATYGALLARKQFLGGLVDRVLL
ncbi:MAG: hypothetical protein EPN38_05960 [Rhodanobacteraceae bacterium]|nr:MAG: hypothetical protein EPN38_05960 [Rhodanobacteraceae bacterium]